MYFNKKKRKRNLKSDIDLRVQMHLNKPSPCVCFHVLNFDTDRQRCVLNDTKTWQRLPTFGTWQVLSSDPFYALLVQADKYTKALLDQMLNCT